MGWLTSSVGRKQLIGVTGLGLCGFLVAHMAPNMLILFSAEMYNKYSHALISNPLIYAAEVGLLLLFLGHLVFALRLSWMNWRARDTRYAVMSNGPKRTAWAQRSLWAQGLVILVFVILHLITFKYGTHYSVTYDGVEMRDLHKLVVEVFSEPAYVIWYVVALFVLFFHLRHGLGSSLQTLGINHPRYNCAIKVASWAYAVIVVGGFLSQPIYVYLLQRG
ncbi:MAG: succinate dehydrogenase cytochrome b subunit [Bdellovibrionales bacterium]|nr:succinate dehydrogenase cytochrome b subunit [Bdellovibrionales bacterium]